jgi:hypothetical protein
MGVKLVPPERRGLKINLRVISRQDGPIDDEEVWQALVDAFRNHPTLDVYQAEIGPDVEK